MTAREIVQIERSVAEALPRFGIAPKAKLLLLEPAKTLLKGVTIYGSGFDKTSFYCHYFVMPLFVKEDHLTLSYGDRTRPGRWKTTQPDLIPTLANAVRDQALPFLDRFHNLRDFVNEMLVGKREDLNRTRELAYALVILCRPLEAVQVIDAAQALRTRSDIVQWQVNIIDELATFKGLLLKDACAAQQQLVEWEEYTVRRLRLEEFR